MATIVLADIKGSTTLGEQMSTEDFVEILNHVFRILESEIYRFGGEVDQFRGDCVVAFFGAKVAHEDDPERAVLAALAMQEAMRTYAAELAEREGIELLLRVGVNTGEVIAARIGDRRYYSEDTAMGQAVALANRLESAAEPGTVLVSESTYRLTQPLFEWQPLDEITVKGVSQPVAVYRPLAARVVPGKSRGIPGLASPLVGREAEFRALQGAIGRLQVGVGGIVSVIGEAGVGKSRLMAEILRCVQNDDRGLLWLEGRALSFGQMISYWPFQQILRRYAGITEDDSEAEVWRRLESRVSALFAEQTAETLPYLATLLALEVRGEYAERVEYLDSEAMAHQVFLTSRRFFERLAQSQPLVLVFEDLHWMDESSVILLEHLLPLVERAPLLICGVSRPYRQTPAARLREVAAHDFSDRYVEIQLDPLSQADSAQLLNNLLEIENLSLRIREMILRKAEGNPFFLEEIIRAMIDIGAVVRDPTSGRWRATAQAETITIPDTLQGVIIARVDRLDEDVKRVLRTASVIGRSFLYRVLRAVDEVDRQLDQHVAELQETQLIRERQRVPELEYIFKHALAQEAIYENILLQRRRELHAQVGEAIETLFADRLEEFYGLLAYHYARAEAWEKAQEYLLKAGDQAGRVAADAEALVHYRQAVAAYARAFEDEWDPVERAALERKMGEALLRRGEHAQALDFLQRALAHLGRPLSTSRWGVRLAILREIVQQIGHRLLPGLFLKRMSRPISPAAEEEVCVYESLGWVDVLTSPEHFVLVSLRALNVSERNRWAYGVALGSAAMGMMCDFIYVFWLAESYHRRAVAVAEQIQHPFAVGMACQGMMIHKLALGEREEMLKYAQRSVEAYREAGHLHYWGLPVCLTAIMLAYQGNLSQALRHCQDLVRFGQEGADLQVRCWGLSTQGFVQWRLGQLDEAVAALQKGLELAKAIPDLAFRISASADLGRCYLRQDRLEQALAAFQESQAFYVANIGGDSYVSLRNGLAEAYLLVAEQRDESERADWLKKARHTCRDARKLGAAFRPGLPEAMRLQGTYEWLRGKPTAAQKWWQRSLALAEELGQRYDLGMTYLEMGRWLGERAHLEQAEAIFIEIGAEWDQKRAREALGKRVDPDF